MAHRTDGNNSDSYFFQHLLPCPRELATRTFDIPKPARMNTYLFN